MNTTSDELVEVLAVLSDAAEKIMPKVEKLFELEAAYEVPGLNEALMSVAEFMSQVRWELVAVANDDAR